VARTLKADPVSKHRPMNCGRGACAVGKQKDEREAKKKHKRTGRGVRRAEARLPDSPSDKLHEPRSWNPSSETSPHFL